MIGIVWSACEQFVHVDPPRTDLTRSEVFASDKTANAAMLDIYFNMAQQGFASGDATGISYLASISADEQIDYTTGEIALEMQPFYQHALTPLNLFVEASWTRLYSWIYKSNVILEGLQSSSGITSGLRRRLEGEAKFTRAFSYFYLVNLWGPVPLVLTTDNEVNRMLFSEAVSEVYSQIIHDLTDALELLPVDYSLSLGQRTRVNMWVATALLARVYLYTGDWENAETHSTAIVVNSELFKLEEQLNDVFAANNKEAIWQFYPNASNIPQERVTFYFSGTPSFGALREEIVDSFEVEDKRSDDWIGRATGSGGETYYFAKKYHSLAPLEQYSTVMRLAEQYLIRAEARAHQGNLVGALQDVNAIRARANVSEISTDDNSAVLLAIYKERKLELFTEWGHRWLDLKRTRTIDQVLAPLKPEWRSEATLFPIPESQVLNSSVKQNPGY
jgi:hypothetical protein